MEAKFYIVVDDTLTPSQRSAQAAHAATVFMDQYGQEMNVDWHHQTIVVVEANQQTLENTLEGKNKFSEIRHSGFRDSDLDNMITAIAFEPIPIPVGRKLFGRLKLA